MSSTVEKLVARSLAFDTERAGPDALDLEAVYTVWFHEVCRWVRAFGGLEADAHDLAQEVFLVVRRKLPHFDGHNLKGWLYAIARRTVRDYRRAAWFRRVLGRPSSLDSEQALGLLVEPGRDPVEELERREAERCVSLVLDRMSQDHRIAFVLFEIEGYAGEEIAALEGVSINTIWSRLRRARAEVEKIVQQLRREGRLS